MKDYSKPNQEVIIERKQAIMLFSAGVLVMILVFALGVLFGKNLANRKLAKEKTELAKKAIFPEPAEPKPVPGTTSEIAQKIQEQKPPTALSGATVKPSAETQAPAQKPTPETQAQPPKPVAPEEWYAIQVASFPEKSSAEELIKQLKDSNPIIVLNQNFRTVKVYE